MSDETMTATRTVDAPPATVFAVLADPASHAAIDGTGWVREPEDPGPLTASGQIFRIGMYHSNHPDGSYRMANRVEAFDPPRAISWQPGQDDGSGEIGYGGWFWRYDLEPVDEHGRPRCARVPLASLGGGGTRVTLTYDWSAVPAFLREHIAFPPFGPDHLESSLANLDTLARA